MPPDRNGSPKQNIETYADKAAERLKLAQRIADDCRHDEGIHRIAMNAVFVLEDTLFALRQIAEVNGTPAAGQTAEAIRNASRDRI